MKKALLVMSLLTLLCSASVDVTAFQTKRRGGPGLRQERK